MMQWIFPMAGKGTRVASLGEFKPFIKVSGRMIVEWCLLGLLPQITKDDSLHFVVTQAQEQAYRVEEKIRALVCRVLPKLISPPQVIKVAELPSGPACTVALALQSIDFQKPVTICNPDQYIRYKAPEGLSNNDGAMVLYYSNSPKSSYVVIEDGLIHCAVEKKVISNNASAGVYAFGSGQLLQDSLNRAMVQEERVNGELFLAPVMNQIIAGGGKVYPVPCYSKLDLGDLISIADFQSLFLDFQVSRE